MLITPEGYGGNYFNLWSRRGKEFQFLIDYEFSKKQWHGTHELRVGVDIDYRSFFGTTVSQPIQILRVDNTLAETINFGPSPAQNSFRQRFFRIYSGPLAGEFARER